MRRSRKEHKPDAVFGRRVAQARSDLGWSQQRLADEVGVNRTDVWKLENARRAYVSIEEVFGYAATLGLHPIDLLVPLEDSEGIEIAGKVRPGHVAHKWIIGRGLLRGAAQPSRAYLFRQMPRARLRALVAAVLTPPPEKQLAWMLSGLAEKHDRLIDEAVNLLRNLPIEMEEEDV